jgi:hypothetical protein
MTDEPCAIEDLEAIVPSYDRWDVKPDGELGDYYEHEDHGLMETSDIQEYRCANCNECFTPEKKFDLDALAKAWQAALDHLKGEGVAA